MISWGLGPLCLAFVPLLTWLPAASLLSRFVVSYDMWCLHTVW